MTAALLSAILLVTLLVPRAHAISGGTDDADLPANNAAVSVNGASGTLIAPDLVITAGHATGIVWPDETPPFRSCGKSVYPDRWYRVAQAATVVVGAYGARPAANGDPAMAGDRTTFTLASFGGNPGDPIRDARIVTIRTVKGGDGSVREWSAAPDEPVDLVGKAADADGWISIDRVGAARRGEPVRHGDTVRLRLVLGAHIRPASAARPYLVAAREAGGAEDDFRIIRQDGTGPVRDGDRLSFLHLATGKLIAAPFITTAAEATSPGCTDIAMLRLRDPVPPHLATPSIPLTRPPGAVADPHAFLTGRPLIGSGYGVTCLGPAIIRQAASFRLEELGSGDEMAVIGTSPASAPRGWDSGSGLYWIDAENRRRTVSVTTKGPPCPFGNRGVVLPLLYRGGVDALGVSRPDTGAWIEHHLAMEFCDAFGDIEQVPAGLRGHEMTRLCGVGYPEVFATIFQTERGLPVTGEPDASCMAIDAGSLAIRETATENGAEDDAPWALFHGDTRLIQAPGSYEPSYMRLAYLRGLLIGYDVKYTCLDRKSVPNLVYFRG